MTIERVNGVRERAGKLRRQFLKYYGQDVQMSQFYRIPKTLYLAECFKDVSFAAEAIYGMMIDRVGLSIKNQWLDEEGKTTYAIALKR